MSEEVGSAPEEATEALAAAEASAAMATASRREHVWEAHEFVHICGHALEAAVGRSVLPTLVTLVPGAQQVAFSWAPFPK